MAEISTLRRELASSKLVIRWEAKSGTEILLVPIPYLHYYLMLAHKEPQGDHLIHPVYSASSKFRV
jgi:hypothetical protein